jgi:hypothetical protein
VSLILLIGKGRPKQTLRISFIGAANAPHFTYGCGEKDALCCERKVQHSAKNIGYTTGTMSLLPLCLFFQKFAYYLHTLD